MPVANKGVKTRIFRITHCDNLNMIITNGLICPNSTHSSSKFTNIGLRQLIQQRGNTIVPVGHGGVLNDYVPFYFAPRSPMLFSISKGSSDYSGTQKEVIYLVTNIEKIEEANRKYVFTDAHAKAHIADFYVNIDDLAYIDWKLMNEIYWKNTPEDNDRRNRRMAEFLVYQFVPIDCILAIAVMTNDMKEKVESILNNHNIKMKVAVKRDWYY